MLLYKKQLKSGLYIRKFDRYINADTSSSHAGTNDDPSRLEGYLDANWSDEGVLTQVNRSSVIADLDTHVVCGLFKPDVSGTWEFRVRADDAGYIWVGSNAEPLEWDLNKTNAVGDRGGGDAFRIDFSGPAGSTQSAALGTVGRDGTGFYFHNPYAPNGYNLNS